MKKIFAIMALAISGAAFAGSSATVEFADYTNQVSGGANSKQYSLAVKHDLNKTFAADVAFGNQVTDGTGALSTRLEAGITGATAAANADQTHTARASLSYALSKNDSVALGYDQIRGDSQNNVVKVSYTRGF